MRFKSPILIAGLALTLVGCGTGPKAERGTIVGIIAGGIISQQAGGGFWAGVAGGAFGGFLGNVIGTALDEESQKIAYEAQNRAFDSKRKNRIVHWRNPKNGNSGRIKAKPVTYVGIMPCRQFTHTVFVKGKSITAGGMTCRQPDGKWTIASM